MEDSFDRCNLDSFCRDIINQSANELSLMSVTHGISCSLHKRRVAVVANRVSKIRAQDNDRRNQSD